MNHLLRVQKLIVICFAVMLSLPFVVKMQKSIAASLDDTKLVCEGDAFSINSIITGKFSRKTKLEFIGLDWTKIGNQLEREIYGKVYRLLPDGKILEKSHSLSEKSESYKCDKSSVQLISIIENIKQEKEPESNPISSFELTAAKREAERLRNELKILKEKQRLKKQLINSDTEAPQISAYSRHDGGMNSLILGKVTDNVEVVDVIVGGETIQLGSDGSFETSFYVPRAGAIVEIFAFDKKGNKATKTLKLERDAVQEAAGVVFSLLNPSNKKVALNRNSLALVIGISDYERTPARAAYADKDAQTFRDYAMLKLGIPSENIKELVNTNAGEVEVRLAVKDWIARTTKQGMSDVYVFFAGHGLASEDGEKMYLLPYDGSVRLLDQTAILRDELFSDIASANPRSVTVFLDTCYSGTTRGTDMLVASRPIAIRAKQQNIPNGFTVFTAAGGDQTAKPLEEAKHGMFSYFLMKGMEGDADSNRDNQITAAELHEYVEQNVVQQSGGSQVPELQGDAGRVLVRFQ